MSLPKIDDVRKLNDQELSDEIVSVKRQLFELRLQQATRQLEKPHEFKHSRHRLAQLMTVERERQIAAAKKENEKSPVAQSTETESQVQEEE